MASLLAASRATFFTVADARYFLGATALINSLRICGHREEIVLLDSGLSEEQRLLLSAECTLVPRSDFRRVSNGTYYKLLAPLARPAGTMVLIDSDIIITGSLDALITEAARGKVVGFPDPEASRWFAEWEQIFALPSRPRRDIYINAGLVAFSAAALPDLLDQWWNACQRTLEDPTVAEGGRGPTSQADQDALNALLMSAYPRGTVSLRLPDEAPQAQALKRGVDILDDTHLRCAYGGQATLLLHSADSPKPWVTIQQVRKTAFTTLLRRLLTRPDVPIRPPDRMIPPWLRDSVVSGALLSALNLRTRGQTVLRHLAAAARRARG